MSSDGAVVVHKKQKMIDDPQSAALIVSGPLRTSSLLAPTMLLTGHEAEVYAVRFNPNGQILATSSFDKNIFLWNVYGECENFMVLSGHNNAVLEIAWNNDGSQLYSASADKSGSIWDIETGRRIKRIKEHTSIVNSIACNRKGAPILLTGSDDGTAKLWDPRQRTSVFTYERGTPVTAVALAQDANTVFVGGIDNEVAVFDVRKDHEQVYSLKGHSDTVTCARLSPDGSYLLTNGMDSTVRVWDVRPYAPMERCLKIFMGAQHNFEKNLIKCNWSADGQKIAAGSADRHVYVWDTTTRQILYRLHGHSGCVNEVDFHPTEPIIGSCASDKKIFLGEIQ